MLLLINEKGLIRLKTNITLLLPSNIVSYQKKIGKVIADKLGMYFADVNDLLCFELSDLEHVLSVGGKEYLENQENKIVKQLGDYSNTLISISFDVFIRTKNLEILKNSSIVIYLKLEQPNYLKLLKKEKKDSLEEKVFLEKDKILQNVADITIHCKNTNKKDILNLILIKLNQFYD